jgi:hypothetical protein
MHARSMPTMQNMRQAARAWLQHADSPRPKSGFVGITAAAVFGRFPLSGFGPTAHGVPLDRFLTEQHFPGYTRRNEIPKMARGKVVAATEKTGIH